MRLSEKEIETIKSEIYKNFGAATIYLFGSRLQDDKKGGDIDLFVISKGRSNLFEKRIKTAAKLERALSKPVDIVVHRDFNREIEKEAMMGERIT